MSLPGNVARLCSADLIDFDAQPIEIMISPDVRSLTAWTAAEEAERRFMMFDWLAVFVPDNRNRLLFSDFATGFLLSFEVAIQHFKKDYESRSHPTAKRFFDWLQGHADPDSHGDPELYNVEMRGLRLERFAHQSRATL